VAWRHALRPYRPALAGLGIVGHAAALLGLADVAAAYDAGWAIAPALAAVCWGLARLIIRLEDI
jgi:hypothetical protein